MYIIISIYNIYLYMCREKETIWFLRQFLKVATFK